MRRLRNLSVGIFAFVLGTGTVMTVESVINSVELATIPALLSDSEADRTSLTLSDTVDFRIDGIGMDSSEAEVRKAFGRGRKVDDIANYDQGPTVVFRSYIYDGLNILLSRDSDGKFKVQEVTIDKERWRFRGVGVGSSVADVERAFGVPAYHEQETLTYFGVADAIILELRLVEGRVTEIVFGYSGC